MIMFGAPISPQNRQILRMLPQYSGSRSKWKPEEVEFAMNVARAEDLDVIEGEFRVISANG